MRYQPVQPVREIPVCDLQVGDIFWYVSYHQPMTVKELPKETKGHPGTVCFRATSLNGAMRSGWAMADQGFEPADRMVELLEACIHLDGSI